MTGTSNNQHWSHTGATLSRLFISLSRAESRAVIFTRSTHRPTSSHIATLPVPVRLQLRIHFWNSTPLQLQSTRVPQHHSDIQHSATRPRHHVTSPQGQPKESQSHIKPHPVTSSHHRGAATCIALSMLERGSTTAAATTAAHHRSMSQPAPALTPVSTPKQIYAHISSPGGASSPHCRARSDSGRAQEEGQRSRCRRGDG